MALGLLAACGHAPGPAERTAASTRPGVRPAAPAPPPPSPPAISLQELEEAESYSGAGTSFQLASAPPDRAKIIFGYADPAEPAPMRINHRLVWLKHVGSEVLKAGRGPQGVGERVRDTWADGAIIVEFDHTTTVVGEGGVGYKGTVTVKMNGQTARFPVTGGSGC